MRRTPARLAHPRPVTGRARIAAAIAVVIACAGSPALAQPTGASADERKPVIAVLPLAATQRLAIYSVPVANAIARRLRQGARWQIELVADGDAVPSRVDIVVDGSISNAADGQVVLSVRVRDPETGTARPAITSPAVALSEVDTLADEIGEPLEGALASAIAAQRRRRAAETSPVASDLAGDTPRGSAAGTNPRGPAGPPLVVFTAAGERAKLVERMERAAVRDATREALRAVARLGFRPVVHDAKGIVEPAVARAALAAAGAEYGLMLDIRDVTFARRPVLMARARFRVVLIDREARALVDAVRRTDTVVGSRGDLEPALIRFSMAQVANIAYAACKRVIAPRGRR